MPSSEFIDVFEGLAHGKDPVSAFSPRRALNTPRELVNLVHDEHGQLWLPEAAGVANLWEEFGTGVRVKHIANVAGGGGTFVIVQLDSEVYAFSTSVSDPTPQLLIADVGADNVIWVNANELDVYIGTPAGTWKVNKTGAETFTTASLPAEVNHGFHSYTYLGRRFVLQRNQTVWFSEINQPETFTADSTFQVGGDQTGGSWNVHPGSVVAFVEMENILLIFCTNSVWALTGSSPDNFQLRRTNSHVGCWARDTVVRVDDGILFFGGTPRSEQGVYLFTGNQATLVSEDISGFFRDWQAVSGDFTEANGRFNAVRWRDRYLLSARGPDADRQVYAYHLGNRQWSTLGNFSEGPALGLFRDNENPGLDKLLVSHGKAIYATTGPLLRSPGAPAGQLTLGWHDQGRPSGLVRFLGLKVGAWTSDGGHGTLDVTARVPGRVGTWNETASTDFHTHAVVPLSLRGKAIEFEMEVQAGEAVLESVELVFSRKPEKMSRG